MSTRRTTRATSKAASSRDASPSLVERDIPTPSRRRSSRKTGSLPAVPTRASTAYGTNSTLQPTFLNRPEISQPLDHVLSGLLEPVREEGAPSIASTNRGGRAPAPRGPRSVRGGRRTASATPLTDRSFFNESGIFGDAGIESSIASSELGGIPEIPESPIVEPVVSYRMTPREREQREQEQVLREIARNPVAGRAHQQAIAVADSLSQFKAQSVEIASTLASNIKLSLYWILTQLRSPLSYLCMSIFSIVALSLLAFSSNGIQWYGLDFRHNIGQFIPFSVAHPMSYFNPNEIQQLQIRMNKAEYNIAHLKQRSDLDETATFQLEQILPDYLVCRRDKDGNLQITQEFWHALNAKMRSEGAYFQHEVTGAPPKGSSTTDITTKQIESILEKSKIWDRFLTLNRAKIMAWSGEEFDDRFPKKLKGSIADGVVVSKPEFIDLIRHNWDKTQKEIRSEVYQLTKKLDSTVHHIESGIAGHTMEEVKDISIVAATDVFKKLFSIAQLEALAKANQKIHVNSNAHRLNHFSQGTGAVINPRLTSPDFAFPSMNRNLLVRGFMRFIWSPIPSPNPPKVALERWEEHGDCWCSPSKDANGYGPSLAVIMGNNIYPDEVVIEHIPTTGALEPGATPKDMELLAYIDDRETYDTIKKISHDLFQQEAMEDEQHPIGYVRIGTWAYDAESLSHIQSFPLQIDLKLFQASTNRLILRSKNNWGGDKVDFTCLYRVRIHGEVVQPTA